MSEERKKSPLARVLGFFWTLIKFILVLAVIAALGIGIYWGGYYAYWGIVSPIASNTKAINLLQDDLDAARNELGRELTAQNEKDAQLSTQMADYGERIASLEEEVVAKATRIAELEKELSSQSERAADDEERITVLEDELGAKAARIAELEKNLSSQSERVAGYAERLTGLKDELDARATQIAGLEVSLIDGDQRIADLEKGLSSQNEGVAELAARLAELEAEAVAPEEEIAWLKVQSLLLKASQEAIKARIRLIQNNPGAAKEELELVEASLMAAFELGDDEARAAISNLQDRLADVMRDITENPFAASEGLEILWRGIDALIGPSD